MSNIYIRHPISISDVRYLYPTSDIHRAGTRARISDVRNIYWMSEIYIGCRKYISDVGNRYPTSDIDIGQIGVILS